MAIINAASTSSTDVQTAINAASAGDTVQVPAGTSSWAAGSVTLSKAITLQGVGDATDIDVSGTPGSITFSITKQAGGLTRIKNMLFRSSNNNNFDVHPVNINGAWTGTEPVILQNLTVVLSEGALIRQQTTGGVIYSHITCTGIFRDFLITAKYVDPTSWATADSIGMNDPTGKLNTYLEDCTFNGSATGVIDADDSCRIVFRHNRGNSSGMFNSHGCDSSPYGVRHFEIYENDFYFDAAAANASGDVNGPYNVQNFMVIKGGSGVVYNNRFHDEINSTFGHKHSVEFWLRGAETPIPGGLTCATVTYPVLHQLGQNNNGSADFTDPIYFWGNTADYGTDSQGFAISVIGVWQFGNPCSFNWGDWFQWGRDAINTSGPTNLGTSSIGVSSDGTGGTAKAGYTAFTYPHPLLTQTTTTATFPQGHPSPHHGPRNGKVRMT